MRNAENCRLNGTKLSADFNFDYYGEFYMKIDNKKARIILAVIIAVSLVISTVYMFAKQGFHEDELLTYNLANSSKQLNVDGGWNSPEDFNEYLAVSPDDRFDYAQVYENQIIDASASLLRTCSHGLFVLSGRVLKMACLFNKCACHGRHFDYAL